MAGNWDPLVANLSALVHVAWMFGLNNILPMGLCASNHSKFVTIIAGEQS